MADDHERQIQWILGRRSVRKFRDQPVEDGKIESILQAAMAAPSACAKDPWRFIVVRDQKTLAQMSAGLPNGKFLAAAALGICVCGDLDAAHDRQISYLLQDCSAAVENMLLAAHSLGLGACWLGVHPREDRIKHIRQALKIPEEITPLACLAIGYPAEEKSSRTRYVKEYVHYEKW